MNALWAEYIHIVTDPAHLLAELSFILFADVLIGALLWPLIKRAVRNHDRKHHPKSEVIHDDLPH